MGIGGQKFWTDGWALLNCIFKGEGSLLIRKFILVVILFSVCTALSSDITLDQFLARILSAHPSLKTLQSQIDGQQATLENTGAMPDPFLSYESAPNTMIKLNQKVNNPLRVQTDQALSSSDLAISELRLQAAQRTLMVQAKKLYYRLYALSKLLDLTREEQRVFDQMYQSGLRQYETNLATQQDPLTLSLMRTELTIKLEQMKQEQRSLLAEAKYLAGGDNVSFLFPETLPVRILSHNILFYQEKAASTGNLEIARAVVEFERANLAKHLTDFPKLFEFEMGAGYDMTMSTFGGMVGISLPLWISKTAKDQRYLESREKSASEDARDIVLRVQSEIADLVYKIQFADRVLPLYGKDILPKARQARNLAQISYQTGKQRLNEWAAAEQRYLSLHAQYFQVLTERLSLEAELESKTGTRR